jgi:Zn-dependent membrane protease YugP
MYLDMTYIILVLPAVIFALWASSHVNSTFNKYSKQFNSRNLTGAQAARFVLDRNGCRDVRIERISGNLTDHYDPTSNVIRLSDSVYDSTSSAAVGVACHEAGHAIQYAENYAPIKMRAAIIPITNIGSRLAVPLIILGLVLCAMEPSWIGISYLGIACFGLSTVFQLLTLPTEFNASNRAIAAIENSNLLMNEELTGAKKVLKAAALTYVAALAVSLMQLLRLLILVNRRRD